MSDIYKMTLIVAVGNKNGISVAADSTGSVGHKTFNVNKLFQLSTKDPIGIAICGSSDFMNVLLEIVVKDYRRKTQKSINKVSAYVDDFIKFLGKQGYINSITEDVLLDHVIIFVGQYINTGIEDFYKKNIIDPNLSPEELLEYNRVQSLIYFKGDLNNKIAILSGGGDIKGLDIFPYGELIQQSDEKIKNKFLSILPHMDQELYVLLLQLVKLHFTKDLFSIGSRLIFFGYGKEEYIPAIQLIDLYYKVNNSIVYAMGVNTPVESGSIFPYAQTDEVYATLLGMSNTVSGKIHQAIDENLTNLAKVHKIDIDAIQKHKESLFSSIRGATEVYKGTLLEAVSLLSKDELGRISEHLVNIGSLKRRVSMEDETIGGPIDVAVLTKSDGFVWIKRKHYFDPAINSQYFN